MKKPLWIPLALLTSGFLIDFLVYSDWDFSWIFLIIGTSMIILAFHLLVMEDFTE